MSDIEPAPIEVEPAPEPDEWGRLAGRLAAGFAAVTAVFAFVGVGSGRVERILRNEYRLSLLWFILIGAGIMAGLFAAVAPRTLVRWSVAVAIIAIVAIIIGALVFAADDVLTVQGDVTTARRVFTGLIALAVLLVGLIGTFFLVVQFVDPYSGYVEATQEVVSRDGIEARGLIIIVGFVVFVGGFYGAFRLAAVSAATTERPNLSAKLVAEGQGLAVEARVRAAGLRSDDHVLVIGEVDGRDDQLSRIYTGRTGPDAEGKVDDTIRIPTPRGPYAALRFLAIISRSDQREPLSCLPEARSVACAEIAYPQSPARPKVEIAWLGGEAVQAASVSITMDPLPVTGALGVRVWMLEDGALLHESAPVAGADQRLDYTVVVPAGPPAGRLCVVASASPADTLPAPSTDCPPSGDSLSAVEVVVPSPSVKSAPG